MTVTAQTNTTLVEVAQFLLDHDDFVVCGHVSPDGDCIGSQLGLAAALRALGKRVACVLAQNVPIDPHFAFLPGAADMVPASKYEGPCATFVAVDVSTRERIGEAARLLDRAEASLAIDHHAVSSTMADLAYIDPGSPAAALLVWQVAGLLGTSRVKDVAQCCYTGTLTDTGRFQYQSTTSDTFRAAAAMVDAGADVTLVAREVFQNRSLPSILLESRVIGRMRFGSEGQVVLSWVAKSDFDELGAARTDAEGLVDTLRNVAGVRVACLLREQEGGVRGNLRAKDASNVSVVAQGFGGGGHKAASGFTVKCSMEEARELVWQALVEAFPPEEQEEQREAQRA